MSFGLFWLSTVVMSNFMLGVSLLRVVKDIVDDGYKIHVTKKPERIKNESDLPTYLILLIPVANIISMLSFSSLVINNRNVLFDEFKSRGLLKEMTDKEKEEYSKNPSLINAFKMCIKADKDEKIEVKKEELILKLSFESIEGEIEYTLNDNEVKIISSTVDSNKYSEQMQRNIVKSALKLIHDENFKTKENYNKIASSNPNKIIKKIKNYKITRKDEDIIKRNYLNFVILDKYNEALKNKKEAEKLEKELSENKELSSEKLELINKLKAKYKELILEISKINNNLSNIDNSKEENKVQEERILKR